MTKLFPIILFLLFSIFLPIDEITESHSNGAPKTIKTYKVQNNKLILEREREFYSNGILKYDRKFKNGEEYSFNSWGRDGGAFKVNLRKYYFPIDSFIDSAKVYIYKNNETGAISDIIKCQSFVEASGDTLFVSTFYDDFYSLGSEWKELCSSEGLVNISSKESKMINSPLFEYNQQLGDKSKASYYHRGEKIFWERTFVDTLDNMIVYKDIFRQNNKIVYSRTLFYKDGVGRLAVKDSYGLSSLVEIIDLDTFEKLQQISGNE
tara:strand:+ start:63 stop:854 length:792 start_codon:yes stop_codon:yes gene_type:complete